MKFLRSPYALLTLAMLGWSGNVLLGRAMREVFTPTSLSFWRWSLALCLTLPFLALPLWRKRAVLVRHWKVVTALGLLGISAFNWLLYQAVESTTATNTALIYANTPIFIVMASWMFFREKITLRRGIGIVLSTAGVVVVIARGDLDLLLALRFTGGDLWALSTVPVWGVYTILLRYRPVELTPLEFQGVLMVVGWLGLIPFYVHAGASELAVDFSLETVGAVIYLAVVASILCFVFWNVGVDSIGAGTAGLFTHLYPLFATVLAIGFLGEFLQRFHVAGGAMIFAGLALTTLKPPPARTQPTSIHPEFSAGNQAPEAGKSGTR